jgi:DNA integrity scanning protein DisA with diadenylate cyclase activity
MRAGLTISHRTQQAQLSELLNSLEREVESLHSKYCEAYVTLTSVMEHLARLGAFTNVKITIDREEESE